MSSKFCSPDQGENRNGTRGNTRPRKIKPVQKTQIAASAIRRCRASHCIAYLYQERGMLRIHNPSRAEILPNQELQPKRAEKFETTTEILVDNHLSISGLFRCVAGCNFVCHSGPP